MMDLSGIPRDSGHHVRRKVRIGRWQLSLGPLGLLAGLILLAGGGVYASLGGGTSIFSSNDIELQRGLVSNWKFDGNLKDATPNALNGSAATTAYGTDRKGKANSVYSMGSGINTVTASAATMPTSTISVSAWVNISAFPGAPANFDRFVNNNWVSVEGSWLLMVSSTGQPYFGVYTSGIQKNASCAAGTLTINTWHLMTGTYDGTTVRLYLDGALCATTAAASSVALNTTLSINAATSGGAGTTSYGIDDVRIYNRAVTANEAAALYKTYEGGVKLGGGQDNLLGWWKLDGNSKDSSPYADNGTASNATLTTDRKGASNTAYSFNGTNGLITVPYSANFRPTAAITMSSWIYPTSLGTQEQKIISNTDGGGFAAFITGSAADSGCNANSLCVGGFASGSYRWAQVTYSGVLANNTWYHVVGTYDGANFKLYVNGVLLNTLALASSLAYSTNSVLCFGAEANTSSCGTQNFIGSIDDVRIYGKALSLAEIQQQYQSYSSQIGIGGAPGSAVNLGKGLVGYWPMNGNAKDMTPYGDNGTITGATLTTDRKGRANSAYNLSLLTNSIAANATNLPTSAVSISTWASVTGAPSSVTRLINDGWANPGGWLVYVDSSLKPSFGIINGASAQFNATCAASTFTAGVWHHMVGVYDGTTIKLYFDGALCGTTASLSGQTLLATGTFEIGAASGSGTARSVDDVRVYGRALSAAEVTALYKGYQ